jgi:hypothetical protein
MWIPGTIGDLLRGNAPRMRFILMRVQPSATWRRLVPVAGMRRTRQQTFRYG